MTETVKSYAAVDLGASSGRVMVGRVGPDTLELSEAHRFVNRPVRVPEGLRWDVLALYGGVLDGLRAAGAHHGGELDSVGIDSWAVDYGLLDNLTLSGTFPFVSKFTQSSKYSGIATGIGDLVLGARFQPFVQSTTGGPTFTFTSSLSLPTGRSPFDQIIGQNLSTGSGYAAATVGVNASQVFDPVALFGSLNFTAAKSVKNLHQANDVDGSELTGVSPGKGIGFGAGFTYALSYNVSTSVSFQENVTTSSHITYLDVNKTPGSRGTAMQVSALLNFGLGLRLNPKTTVNLSAGIGVTTDSPDFSLTLNLPLTFSLF
jgi:hypothetical protein